MHFGLRLLSLPGKCSRLEPRGSSSGNMIHQQVLKCDKTDKHGLKDGSFPVTV